MIFKQKKRIVFSLFMGLGFPKMKAVYTRALLAKLCGEILSNITKLIINITKLIINITKPIINIMESSGKRVVVKMSSAVPKLRIKSRRLS